MAELGPIRMEIQLAPGDDTMKAIIAMLDLWQDAHPDRMVAMVPQGDRYVYEIINRRKKDE
jgi:hypothetical protein